MAPSTKTDLFLPQIEEKHVYGVKKLWEFLQNLVAVPGVSLCFKGVKITQMRGV